MLGAPVVLKAGRARRYVGVLEGAEVGLVGGSERGGREVRAVREQGPACVSSASGRQWSAR